MIYGINDAPRRACAKSPFHGFHPANEPCGYCPPKVVTVSGKSLAELYYEYCCVGLDPHKSWSELGPWQAGWISSAEAEVEFWLRTEHRYPVWHPEYT